MPLSINSLSSYFKEKESSLSPLTKEGTIVLADKPKENEPFFRSHKEIVLITCLVGMSSLAINYAPRLMSFASLMALALGQGGVYSTIGLGSLGALALGYFGLHNSSLGSFLTTAVENVKSHSANKAQGTSGEANAKEAKTQVIEPIQGLLDKPAQDLLDKTIPQVSTLVTNKVQDLVTDLITPNTTTPPSKPADATPATPKPIAKRVDPAFTTQPQKKKVAIQEPEKEKLVKELIKDSEKVKLTSEEIEKFETAYQAGAVRPRPAAPTSSKRVVKKALKKEPKKDELSAQEIKKFERAYKQSNPATHVPQKPLETQPEKPIYSKPAYGPPQTEEIRKITNRLKHIQNHLLGIQPQPFVAPPTLFPSKIQSRM